MDTNLPWAPARRWIAPAVPSNEAQRLSALHRLKLLDTPREERFDRITRLARALLDVPIVLVSLVDAQRQWFKSRQGLEATETPRDVSFCGHAILGDVPFVVEDAALDARFECNPLVVSEPRIRFYAGAPLKSPDGYNVGTLCAIDRKARTLSPDKLALLEDLARLVDTELAREELGELARRLALSEERFSGVFAAAKDAIFIADAAGALEQVNPAACRMLGMTEDDLVGRSVGELLPGFDEASARGQLEASGLSEMVARSASGVTLPVEVATSRVDAGGGLLVAVVRDVSAQKAAAERIRAASKEIAERHQQLLTVLNELTVGAVMLDEDGLVTFVSECCVACLALQRPEGKHWTEILPLDGPPVEALERAMMTPASERVRIDARVRAPGHKRWVEIDVRDNPTAPGFILFVYDQSEIHELRAEKAARAFGDAELSLSEAMRAVYDHVARVASGDWSVLIQGETGSGKERVARAIHQLSPRRDKPFVAVNCAGMTETLLTSELFGHRRGSFTGAVADRKGIFESAEGGTVFLDEVGDMPASMQTALLRVLQEGEVTRVGEHTPRKIDVRTLFATHRDLDDEVSKGRFRADLLYRIRVGRVRVPPLRERPEDIPSLVSLFLDEAKTQVTRLDAEAMQRLREYPWPGNIRELRAAVAHAAISCRSTCAGVADLPPEVRECPRQARTSSIPALEDFQRVQIEEALRQAGGNRAKAARILGVGRATFYRRLAKLGLT